MNRRSMLVVSAAVLSSAGSISAVGVVAGAQQPSEIDKVREASTALYASLSSLDVRPMERFWAHESYVRYIGPTSKAVAVGWDEVKKAIEAGNAALSARRVVLTQAHIQINGQLAWEVGIEMTQRTLKNGEVLNTQNFVTNIYENKKGEWRMVTHHASAVPR
jgi:ketosteroid isomerase-like protein